MTDPPSGLGVVSVEVAEALGGVAALRKSGDHAAALARSREVVDDFPDLQAPVLALLLKGTVVVTAFDTDVVTIPVTANIQFTAARNFDVGG